MPGHDGAYRGVVVDPIDPESAHRVQVQVPDVLGSDPAWASAEDASATVPGIGDVVTVRFEGGDEQRPLWSPGTPPEGAGGSAGSGGYHATYHSTYRGTVIDNVDPGGYRRVAVQVPDVLGSQSAWAMPEHAEAALPALGDEVSVRFEDGSPERPLWSGGSGTGGQQTLDGTHRATVVNNQDPAGLGRLYVQVPGQAEGVWATPEQPPPAVGEEVSVHFAGGAEHATWSRS